MNQRTDSKRFLPAVAAVLFLVATAACFALPAPAAATPSLAKLQREARQTRAQMKSLQDQIQAIDQKMVAAQQHLTEVNARLTEARRQLAHSEAELDAQRELVSLRMATMYKSGDYTWLDIAADSSSLADAETILDFLRRITEQDQSEEDKLQVMAAEARKLEAQVEDERQAAESAQAELDSQRADMDGKLAERGALLVVVVKRIKKILSAPQLLMKAGGKVTQVTWAQALLKALGMPITSENVAAIVSWEFAEGGHWYNTAYYNPLNTTQPMPGDSIFNSVGVRAYPSWAVGLKATVITLHNSNYPGILAALKAGNSAEAVASAVGASPWGTSTFTIR